ncbi:hypothetical protein ACOMHN_057530 [Nucella lapillus]
MFQELTSALQGAQEEVTEAGQTHGEPELTVLEESANQEEATDVESAQEEASGVCEQSASDPSASSAPTDLSKEGAKEEAKAKEPPPQTLAQKLLSKALGNVNKADSAGPASTASGASVSIVKGKLTFSMRPGKVQKVSFGIRAKKSAVKSSGESREEEEEGAKPAEDSDAQGSTLQPSRFKKAMAELFRPDQDVLTAPDFNRQQQQLLQMSQNPDIQQLMQKAAELAGGQNWSELMEEEKKDAETQEEEPGQREEHAESKERKARRASRWSKLENKESRMMAAAAAAKQVEEKLNQKDQTHVAGEQKAPTTPEQLRAESEEASLSEQAAQALGEISDLYKDVMDGRGEQKLKQADSSEDPTTAAASQSNENAEKEETKEREEKTERSEARELSSQGREGRDSERSSLSGSKTHAEDSKANRERRSCSRERSSKHKECDGSSRSERKGDGSSRSERKGDSSSRSERKGDGRKSDRSTHKRSRSRDRGTERGSKTDKDKDRSHRPRSQSRDRDCYRKDDGRSRDRKDDGRSRDKKDSTSPSRSRGKSDSRKSQSEVEDRRKRDGHRSDSRERSKAKQDQDHSKSGDRKETKHRDHSTSGDRKETKHRDHSRSVDRKQTKHSDRSTSVDRKQTKHSDRSGSVESKQTKQRDRSTSVDRKQTKHSDRSGSVESKQTKQRDRSTSVDRKQTKHSDRSTSVDRKQTKHSDRSTSVDRKQTKHSDRSGSVERKQTKDKDSSRSADEKSRTQQRDHNRSEERRLAEQREDSRSDEKRPIRQRGRSRSAERRQTQQKSHRSDERKPVQQGDCSRSAERRPVQQRDNDRSAERKPVQQRDRSRSAERRLTEQRDNDRSAERRLTEQRDNDRSAERRLTEQRDNDRSAERRLTEQRDNDRSAERRLTEQRDNDRIEGRRQPQRDRSRSAERRSTQQRDYSRNAEGMKHTEQLLEREEHLKRSKDCKRSIEGRDLPYRDTSERRYRGMNREEDAWSRQELVEADREREREGRYRRDREQTDYQKDVADSVMQDPYATDRSSLPRESSGTDMSEHPHRREKKSPARERTNMSADARRNEGSPNSGGNWSPDRRKNTSPDGFRTRSPERRIVRSPERRRNSMSPDRGRNRSPRRTGASPEIRRRSISPDRRKGQEHRRGQLEFGGDPYTGGNYDDSLADWREGRHLCSSGRDRATGEYYSRKHEPSSDHGAYSPRDARPVRDDERYAYGGEGLRTSRDDPLIERGGGPRQMTSSSYQEEFFHDASPERYKGERSGYDRSYQGARKSGALDDDRTYSPKRTSSSLDKEKRKSDRGSSTGSKSMKGLKLKLKQRTAFTRRSDSQDAEQSTLSETNTEMSERMSGSAMRSKRSSDFERRWVGEDRSREHLKPDFGKGDSTSDLGDTNRKERLAGGSRKDGLEVTKKQKLTDDGDLSRTSLGSNETPPAEKRSTKSAETDLTPSGLGTCDQEVSSREPCPNNPPPSDLQKKESVQEYGSAVTTDVDSSTKSPTQEVADIQKPEPDSDIKSTEKAPGGKLEPASALKTESVTSIVSSSPRVKSGRFGTASWSSGSKRRERGLRPALDSLKAPVAKSLLKPPAAGSKSNISDVNSESGSVSSNNSLGIGNSSTKDIPDTTVVLDSKDITSGGKLVSLKAAHVDPFKVSALASTAIPKDLGRQAGKRGPAPGTYASSVTADASHSEPTAVVQAQHTGAGEEGKPHRRSADSRKGSKDGKRERKEKAHSRESNRGSHSKRKSSGREEEARGVDDSRAETLRGSRYGSGSQSHSSRGDAHHRARPHEDANRGRQDSRPPGEDRSDARQRDCDRDTRPGHCHREADGQRERRRLEEPEWQEQGSRRERKRVRQDYDDEGSCKRLHSGSGGHDLGKEENDAWRLSPISPEGSCDLDDGDVDDARPNVSTGQPTYSDTGSSRHRGSVHTVEGRHSFDEGHDHSPRLFRQFEEGHTDRSFRGSPGPVQNQRSRFLDHRRDGSPFGRPHAGSPQRWSEQKAVRYGELGPTLGQHVEDRGWEQNREDRNRRSEERFRDRRSHSEERELGHSTLTGRSHSQETDQGVRTCDRSRSHSLEREQRSLRRDLHHIHGAGKDHELLTQNRGRSRDQGRERSPLIDRSRGQEENPDPLSQSRSHSVEGNSAGREGIELPENQPGTFSQEREDRPSSGDKTTSQSQGRVREQCMKTTDSPTQREKSGGTGLETGSREEPSMKREVEVGENQHQSQIVKQGDQVQYTIGVVSTERDPGQSQLDGNHSQDQDRGQAKLFVSMDVDPAGASHAGVFSRKEETVNVPPQAVPAVLAPVSHHSGQSLDAGYSLQCVPDQTLAAHYAESLADPQTDWQAGVYLNQVDPTTLQVLLQQYQAMGYSPEQSVVLVTQLISSTLAQQSETADPQQAVLHGTDASGTASPAQMHLVLDPSAFEGQDLGEHGQQQEQQLSADPLHQHLLALYQAGAYPASYTHLQQTRVPGTSLTDTEMHQPEHSVASVSRDSQQSKEVSRLPFDPVKTSAIQSSHKPASNTAISTPLEGERIKTKTESSSVQREGEDVVSSTNSGESEDMKEQQSGAKEQVVKQPLKVKSRWRRSCEAESSAADPDLQDRGTPGLDEAEASTGGRKTQSRESLPPQKRLKLSVAAGAQGEGGEEFPVFETITDNIHLTQRKRSKVMKRMQCDCTPSKADRARGMPICGEDCLNRMLKIECGSRCPCLTNCSNKRFQKKQYAHTEPFHCGPGKGWGLRASEDLPHVGTFVMEYVGELLRYKEFVRRSRQYARRGLQHHYFMALNADELIDATLKGNNSRFLNHSCNPNCETQKWTVNGELRVGFFTKRTVSTGEELTFDYQFEFYGEPQKCYCGTEKCRGFIGGQKKLNLKKKKRERTWENRKVGLFEDEMLDEDMGSISCLEEGLKLKDHVLDLCRLMVRARKPDHRWSLLKILLNTTEVNCLRLFLGYQGLPLLWSWMVDLGESQEDCSIKMQMLSVLQKLPINNRTVLKESKIMMMVERWATLPGPPLLPEVEVDSASEPRPLPLPRPPDRPLVSILTLHKDSKVRNTPKKRVTFADEAVNSDSDVVSSTINEAGADPKIFTSDPSGQVMGDDDTVSTSGSGLLSSDVDVKSVGEGGEKDGSSVASSDAGQDTMSGSAQDSEMCSNSADLTVGTSEQTAQSSAAVEESGKEEASALASSAKDVAEHQISSATGKDGEVEEDPDSFKQGESNIDSSENAETSGTGPSSSQADSTDTSAWATEGSADFPSLTTPTVGGEWPSLSEAGDQAATPTNGTPHGMESAEDGGGGPPLLECGGEEKEEAEEGGVDRTAGMVPPVSQAAVEGGDEDMPTLVKEGGEVAASPEELDPVCSMATRLLSGWSDLKELYKIPKKQRLEERKRTERELECEKQEDSEPDPYARWKKAKVEKSKKKDAEEEEMKKRSPGVAGPRLSKEVRRQLFEAQVKAEDQLQAQLQRQHDAILQQQQEAILQQQQAAATLLLQQNPALAAMVQGLGHDLSFLASPQPPVYDSSQLMMCVCVAVYDSSHLMMCVCVAVYDSSQLMMCVCVAVYDSSQLMMCVSVAVYDSSQLMMCVSVAVYDSSQLMIVRQQSADDVCVAVYDSMYDSSQLQYGGGNSGILTAEQHQALMMAAQAAGGGTGAEDAAMVTQQLLHQQGLLAPHTLSTPPPQVHGVYASGSGTQLYQDLTVHGVYASGSGTQLYQDLTVQHQHQQLQQQQQQLEQQLAAAQQMQAVQQMTAAVAAVAPPQHSPVVLPAQCLTPTEDEDVPPPPSPPEEGDSLPEHWKRARDAEGRVYYYNTLTRATQWEFPSTDGDSPSITAMDIAGLQDEDLEEDSRRKTTTAPADTSSEGARKIKERFRKQMSKFVVVYLNPYRRPDCKLGRIQNTDDFKHLARRLTHHVLAKELKHCRHVDDLEVNENVKAKARDYVKKYMSRCGPIFKKSSSPDDFV